MSYQFEVHFWGLKIPKVLGAVNRKSLLHSAFRKIRKIPQDMEEAFALERFLALRKNVGPFGG